MLETQLIAKRGDNVESVRWMELGDADAGMTHINGRHIEGTIDLDSAQITSFFPVGQTVKGRQLPATMSQQQVYDEIYRALKEGTRKPDGGEYKYVHSPDQSTGISEITIKMSGNNVTSSLPEDGPAVKKWVPNLNEGQGGWLDER
ncbi:hypothetical protein [Natronorubrum bangense]|uniref:Uncharacterized protein n=2 Tax=Natronorubrum bangense TaxID=61858 RepID=L9WBB0_9EURY|nr:hypothetical protein [Natronorubrum bangense]ELY46541.1 hypothetical protein C494_14528 [Natronorubrum bangense JCM 10635]QCC56543.1 hypothetical protein DV706_18780 [Natronorubrum bangense]